MIITCSLSLQVFVVTLVLALAATVYGEYDEVLWECYADYNEGVSRVWSVRDVFNPPESRNNND